MRVTITTSPTSDTFRRQLLQQYIAMNQYMPSDLGKMTLAAYVMKNLPNIPDNELKDMDEVFDLEIKLLKAQKMVMLMGLNNQAQAAMAPQMPQLPGGMLGGGGPKPSGPAPELGASAVPELAPPKMGTI